MLKLRVMHVDTVAMAKIAAVVNALVGILTAFFLGLAKLLGVENAQSAQFQETGFGSILLLPFMYAIFGALSGFVGAFFFNTAAKWVGPLEINVAEK